MNTKHNTPFDITVELEGVQIQVTGHITPIVKGRWTDKSGDPGWPDEGGEIVIEDNGIKGVYENNKDGIRLLLSLYTPPKLREQIESLTHKKLNK